MIDTFEPSGWKRTLTRVVERARWLTSGCPGLGLRRRSDRLYGVGAFEESASTLGAAFEAWPFDDALTLRLAQQARFGLVATDDALRLFSTVAARGPLRLARRALRDAMNLVWERRGGADAVEWSERLIAVPGATSRDLSRVAALWNEVGRTDDALDLLRDVHRRHPDDLHRLGYLDLAAAADRAGIPGVGTGAAARRVCDHLAAGEGRFADLVGAGADVAVVANGPGLTGLGLGPHIDRHRVVIRFNNHAGGRGLIDQGERTDIWIRPPSFTHVPLGETDGIRHLALTGCNLRHRFSDAVPVLTPYVTTGLPIELAPVDLYQTLFQELDAAPSSGLIGLKWVAHLCGGRVDGRSVFGYSPAENTSAVSHYYGRQVVGAWPSRHNWPAEHAVILSLVTNTPAP